MKHWILDPWREALSPERVGGKAYQLSRLRACGAEVPRFVAVSAEACDALAGLPEAPEEFRREIQSALEAAGLGQSWLAVRSSGLAEDGALDSYAGQFETVLGLRAAGAAEALWKVWASARSERVAAYARIRGAEAAPPRMGAVIQELVDSEVSGVAFSADPVTRRDDIVVISAVFGLGEGLVSGELDADTYRVNGASVETRLLPKARVLRRGEDGSTAYHDLNPAQSAAATLSEAEAVGLAQRFKALEAQLGGPQDFEWALGPGRRLVMLQARPITTLSGALRIWDNSNIVESYSGLTLPLTFSYARGVYEEAYKVLARMLGVPERSIQERRELFANRLGLVRGHVYYNLMTWYESLAYLPLYRHNRAFMESMMGVREALPEGLLQVPEEGLLAGIWRGLRTGSRLLLRLWTLDRDTRDFHALVEAALKPLLADEIRVWDADRLMRSFRSLERDVLLHWHAPLSNDLFAMIYFGALSKMVAPELLNDLLCGEGGIISTEPAKRLSQLARQVRGSEALSALFSSTPDDAALWRALRAHPEFCAELDAYLKRFGARCAMELKLETVPLDDDPPALLRLLRGYLAGPLPSEGNERAIRAAAEAKVFQERNWAKGLLLRYVLARARRSIKHRENQRFERTRCVAVVRRIFQGLGRRLAEAGLIEAERDIFYLEKEEVFGCLDGSGVDENLKALVLARRDQYAGYAAGPTPPDRFRTRGPLAMVRLDETLPSPKEGALAGLGCCPGKVRARVRLVGDPRTAPDLNGFIMAAERTDPGWTLLFPACKGILVERGSLLSHSAIVAREMGIPCVVGIPGLMRALKDGEELQMDGATGEIIRMEAS